MGCINSKRDIERKQINLNRANVFRVYACRISAESGTIQSGYLELSPKELVFSPEVGDTIKWALQHLRRYGCTGDVFSFEAGRRCMTGPGIYTFRCQNAEEMHQLFQSYINTVAKNDETAHMICTEYRNSLDLPSPSNQDAYLEPTSTASSVLYNRTNFVRRDSTQSSPASSNLNSPSSFQGANFTNEVIHLNQQPNKHLYPNSNVYQEFPIKPNEFNNNIPNKKKLQDVPPQEPAPIVQNMEIDSIHPRKCFPIHEEHHMYENVSGIDKSASLERCYENFSSIDLPIMFSEKPSTNENGVVNYITLDLVQSPTSTDSFSLKLKPSQQDSWKYNNVCNKKDSNNEMKAKDFAGNNNMYSKVAQELLSNTVTVSNEGPSTSMGYSTIDFIKTCALIKSAPCDADCQESRITRHSTCVLKTNSLSD